MRVQIRYFARLRDTLGPGTESELPVGTTASAAWKQVIADHPQLAKVPVRFAVNERYVPGSHRLATGDELAVFPPVSGGARA